jgi:ABC-type branched-subunit amino acid transport system substrate-binding protein
MIEVKTIKKGDTVGTAVASYRAAAQQGALTAYVEGVVGVAGIVAQTAREKVPILQQAGNASYVEPAQPYVYSMSFDKEYPDSAVRWAVENKGAKKIGILHYNTDYSTGITKSITDRCKELGCEVTTSQEAAPDASVDQLIPLLTKIKNSGADTYYIETINPNGTKAARQLGMFDKTVISEQWLSVPAIVGATGKDGENITFAAQKCVAPELAAEGDEGAAFCTKYKKLFLAAYPDEPYALFSIYGYDAVYDFANAVKIAAKDGEVTPETVNAAYEKFDGSLRTSHGEVKTSPDSHRLVGTFDQAYLLYNITADGKKITYTLAPDADPKGAQP